MRIVPVAILAACLVLTACGADQPIDSQRAQDKQESNPAASKAAPAKRQKKVDEIAGGLKALEKEVPIYRRYDRMRTVEKGVKQRQVFVEVLGASAQETAVKANAAFRKRGFSVVEGKNDHQGIRIQYRKSRIKLNVLVRSKEISPKLLDPNATASLYVRQNLN